MGGETAAFLDLTPDLTHIDFLTVKIIVLRISATLWKNIEIGNKYNIKCYVAGSKTEIEEIEV